MDSSTIHYNTIVTLFSVTYSMIIQYNSDANDAASTLRIRSKTHFR